MAEMERLESKLGHKPFLVTMEVNPPKGTDASEILKAVKGVAGLVDAVNVTDGSGAIMRACSLAVAKAVLDAGVDPIFQMTCRDRNRLALQADLLGAAMLGIQNLLLLTGDDPKAGDHPDAKPVFDINSATLMQVARGLAQGKDMAGKELKGVPHFCIGAAADPGAKDLEVEMQKFKAKIDGGASFFQTQAVFDAEGFRRLMSKADAFDKPVLAGILLVKSAKMARYMNEHVWGIHVPDELIARF
ncbi:MAG: methylenetetrahydrofolate reductase, partial [Candidatus Omnitrophica bacterium]|nr:methylenetetrahydrofolate reductase [Candidatus Omnitrophota bacterium]